MVTDQVCAKLEMLSVVLLAVLNVDALVMRRATVFPASTGADDPCGVPLTRMIAPLLAVAVRVPNYTNGHVD